MERLFVQWVGRAREFYSGLFSLHEFHASETLRYVFGATILSYLVVFNDWNNSPLFDTNSVREGTHLCWPYFQACGDYAFLSSAPLGYSYTAFYGMLLALLFSSAWYLIRARYRLAHLCLSVAWAWHAVVALIFSLRSIGTFDYYLIVFGAALLFLPRKEFFLKLYIVLFYALSTTTKFNEGWILGSYFTSLSLGMPFFPDVLTPIITNAVILMELVGSWFLLSRPGIIQKSALVFFLAFHLFSSVFVWYRFPLIVIPTLFLLFGPLYRFEKPPVDWKSAGGWLIAVLCIILQSISILIPGNAALTQEGLRYGMYMFDANHQCVSSAVAHVVDGSSYTMERKSASSRLRCDPYTFFFTLKQRCSQQVPKVIWSFDHSINGGPFLRIVDAVDVCSVKYAPFSKNSWIKTELDSPEIIGYPLENWYE